MITAAGRHRFAAWLAGMPFNDAAALADDDAEREPAGDDNGTETRP